MVSEQARQRLLHRSMHVSGALFDLSQPRSLEGALLVLERRTHEVLE